MFMEYAMDLGRLAREAGLKNVFVSNGYMTEEALNAIAPYLDAINVDLKAYKEETYKKVMGARLEPVKETLRLLKKMDIWTEITTLIIPTVNDDPDELRQAAEFIRSLDPDIPWHLSRFHPDYKLLDLPVTPEETLVKARKTAKDAGLRHVYLGNIMKEGGEDKLSMMLVGRCVGERESRKG